MDLQAFTQGVFADVLTAAFTLSLLLFFCLFGFFFPAAAISVVKHAAESSASRAITKHYVLVKNAPGTKGHEQTACFRSAYRSVVSCF